MAKGEAGDDWIAMGAGKVDLAWGGSGADIFFFGEQTSDGERGRTAIGDFEVGTDALDLSGAEVIAHKVILELIDPDA